MNVLLIMPEFFDYPRMIQKALNDLGYDVDYYNDRPSTNNLVKAIIKVNRNYMNFFIKRYFKRIMESIKQKKYDVVLLISGQSLSFSVDMIKKLKECQSSARYILYQWDAVKNFPCIKEYFIFFDKCYSFDRFDVEQDKRLLFLPLFYTDVYEKIGNTPKSEYTYDCSYVGTAHPKKYQQINFVSNALHDLMPRQFIYQYMPSRLKFIYHKFKDKEFKNAKYKYFQNKKLTTEQIIEIFSESGCILDAPQSGQTGLTIRTIECLGAKRKLITTNSDIKNYDFYNEQNILIFNGEIDPESSFFKNGYKDIDENVYKKYSLQNWLKTMLDS